MFKIKIMIKLYDVVWSLSKEENRNVTLFLNRTNADKERKDVTLFDYVRKNKCKVNEEQILKRLYHNTEDKNSFYRLKNRLVNDINKSLLQLHFDKNSYNAVLNLYSLSKVFIQKGEYGIAYNYLLEAESKAIKNEFFDLLDLIYSDFIKLSHESLNYNPITYIDN